MCVRASSALSRGERTVPLPIIPIALAYSSAVYPLVFRVSFVDTSVYSLPGWRDFTWVFCLGVGDVTGSCLVAPKNPSTTTVAPTSVFTTERLEVFPVAFAD